MRKKWLSLFLSIALVFCFSSSVLADSLQHQKSNVNIDGETQKQKVLLIMEQLSQLRANQLLQESKSGSVQAISTSNQMEASLESQLESLGVEKLTSEQVRARYTKYSAQPLITPPPSTSKVKWYVLRYDSTRNGVTYNIEELYAQGLNSGTNLAVGANGATLYTNKQILVKNLINIASIYTQKAIGAIPVVNLLPYELLFTNNDNVTNNSHVVTHRSLTTVCFSYVKRSDQSDYYQNLSYSSNMYTLAASHTLAGYNNGQPYSKTTDKTNTVYADNYASSSKAVDYFISTTLTGTSFVSSYTFYNHDKSANLKYNVLTPTAPGQVN
ncbi:hypothetical protein [Paenibacillus aquistagni]|uniref:Uncharacterized protein n=1 Tax=Paenibacillus aquistagni TaxID=1852522 RepID=A0A1X7KQG4_9BACL|nr:hypothetical protein [Paenibacillus aquistagni]SMG43654.1 hypothetical protein SAMN06295960_2585 [Paenibacillus aquistagni]